MSQLRPWFWFVVAAVLVVPGCRCDRDPGAAAPLVDTSATNVEAPPERPVNHREKARRMLELGNLDAAAEAVENALLQDPDVADVRLLASEIEARRGNYELAVELASSIDPASRLGQKAAVLHSQLLQAMGRESDAANVLIAATNAQPTAFELRHLAWALLNRVGRREDASEQAEALCRDGQQSRTELLSLLRRDDSFPFLLEDGKPEEAFKPGLGLARWFYTQRQYDRAMKELEAERAAEFPTPAAAALYGRILAETQSHELIPAWIAQCNDDVPRHSNYWSALGTYFFDGQQHEAAARAYLEAIYRDPTDDVTAHRLGKVFDALGQAEQAERFRDRAVSLAQLEQAAERLMSGPGDIETLQGITKNVLSLGRPFEVLQWSLTTLPPSAAQQRQSVDAQRRELNRSPRATTMASEAALAGVNRADLDIDQALEGLVKQSRPSARLERKEVPVRFAPRLANVASAVGLDFQWYQDEEMNLASIPLHEVMGGGIAVIDYDLDGWPDVYLAQGSGDPPTDACTRSSILMRNVGAQFADVTPLAAASDTHYSTGIAAGDVNQDGFPDLFLGSLGKNRLLINNGDGTFREATEMLGTHDDRFTSSLAIADLNGDHLPDLYEAVYVEMDGGFKLPDVGPDGREIAPSPTKYYAEKDRWFENRGDGSFQPHDISEEVALAGTAFGVVVTDMNNDGKNDVFVANDVRANHLLVQGGSHGFINVADSLGVANGFTGEPYGCMGTTVGDFNRDGAIDISVTNYWAESGNHYLQTAGGAFTDYAARYRIDQPTLPMVGFGTKAVDVDRNGWLDLIIANGHVFDQSDAGESFHMPTQLLMNRGNRYEEAEVDDPSGYWKETHLGRAIASLDFDRSGTIDFLVGHMDKPVALLSNETDDDGRWIQLELVGTTSERDAIGTRVDVKVGSQVLSAWVTGGDGYLSTDQPVLDVGLPGDEPVDQIEVVWPSGVQQIIEQPRPGRRYLVVEGVPPAYWTLGGP